MKNILRELARRKASESGFAMPVAIGFGLVAILVAGILLIRTQDDKATASLQRASDSSLNIAEAGLTRIQAFINTNRLIATQNWSDWNTTLNTNRTTNDCSGISQQDQVAIASAFATWQDIDPTDASKGQFRILDYVYTPDSSQTRLPGKGELMVQGRLPDQQSIQQIKVTIPVQRDDSNTAIPGLWLTNAVTRPNGAIEVTDNNQVDGNALINDCRVNLSTIRVTPPHVARYTTRPFPPLPSNPSSARNTLTSSDIPSGGGSGGGNGNGNGRNSSSSTSTSTTPGLTLPRSTDVASTKTLADGQTAQVYEYWVANDLRIPQSSSISITPGMRVAIYLNGSLNGNGGGDIVHDCAGATNCRPTDVQIYGYGAVGSRICLNGNDQLYAFILAPNYTAGVAGAGAGGGFYGAVWAKEWSTSGSCGSNTTNAVLHQTADWDLSDLIIEALPARLAPISAWERQEAL
ncbi:MAG: hypothetical protein Kow00121_49210 [Elainellaceae cyanobacterium]